MAPAANAARLAPTSLVPTPATPTPATPCASHGCAGPAPHAGEVRARAGDSVGTATLTSITQPG